MRPDVADRELPAVGGEHGGARDPALGVVGAVADGDLAADAVGLRDLADDDRRLVHLVLEVDAGRERWRPAAARTTVRIALAVRPPRPISLPSSPSATRTW